MKITKREHSSLPFDAVMARAKSAFGKRSLRSLAEELGMSSSAFANRKRSNSIPFAALIETAMKRGVDLHWLFTGDGGPVRDVERIDPHELGVHGPPDGWGVVDENFLPVLLGEVELVYRFVDIQSRAPREESITLAELRVWLAEFKKTNSEPLRRQVEGAKRRGGVAAMIYNDVVMVKDQRRRLEAARNSLLNFVVMNLLGPKM